jgi:hypothetical protein
VLDSAISTRAIPDAARPAAVTKVLTEALDLRRRIREAQEELAAAQAELERLEQEDVAAAAERIRAGSGPGAIPAAISKAKEKVELAKRTGSALGIASEAAQADLAAAITVNGETWLAALDRETDKARERGRKALAALEVAVQEVGAAASAASWLRGGLSDGRFDRRPPVATASRVAPSSARRTANSEALRVDEVLSYARELIDPPEPPARVPMRTADASAA